MVFGANDMAHPAVAYLHNQAGDVYLGMDHWPQPPTHYDLNNIALHPMS